MNGARRVPRWLRLGNSVDPSTLRVVLVDIDRVVTPGEGATAEPELLARLASWNEAAAVDPTMPGISLCSGRQAPARFVSALPFGEGLMEILEHLRSLNGRMGSKRPERPT